MHREGKGREASKEGDGQAGDAGTLTPVDRDEQDGGREGLKEPQAPLFPVIIIFILIVIMISVIPCIKTNGLPSSCSPQSMSW